MQNNRDTFTFDGGTVRFTLAGAVIANLISLLGWLVMIGITLAALILLGFEIAAAMVGFTPLWRI